MHSPSPWLASRTDPEPPSSASPQLRSCYFSRKSEAPLVFLLTMLLSSTGQHKPPVTSLTALLTTQSDQDNPNTNAEGLSHHPHPPGRLGHAYGQGLKPPLPANSDGDAPLSRSPSGDPKRQGGGSQASPGIRWGGRTGSRGCSTAGDQLDPSSPLDSRKTAVSFLVPKTTQQQERSCLRTRQGPSVLQTEEPAAGKAHAGEAAEGQTPRWGFASGYPRGRVPSHPSARTSSPRRRFSTSQAPISAGLPVQGTMACVWIYPSVRL